MKNAKNKTELSIDTEGARGPPMHQTRTLNTKPLKGNENEKPIYNTKNKEKPTASRSKHKGTTEMKDKLLHFFCALPNISYSLLRQQNGLHTVLKLSRRTLCRRGLNTIQ